MARLRLDLFILLLIVFSAACSSPASQAPEGNAAPDATPAAAKQPADLLNDLSSSDQEVRQMAIDMLAGESDPPVDKMIARLAQAGVDERQAIFTIFNRLGAQILPAVVAGLAVVYENQEIIDGMTEYFQKQGEAGYRALLERLQGFSKLTGQEAETPGALEQLDAHYRYFDSLALIMARLPEFTMVGDLPDLLTNPYPGIRTRTAFLLCLKGWRPDHPRDKVIFYTHLLTAPTCPSLPDPAAEAARLAAQDLTSYLEVEKEFPAGGQARDTALAASGSDEVADYLYRQAREARSDFQLLSLYRKLKGMETDRGTELAAKLLADPRLGPALRSLDPEIR